MSKSNLAASVRQRLKNHAKQTGESFNLVLVRFGLERLLYRITTTQPDDLFVLKGGTLFYCWTEKIHRPTRDTYSGLVMHLLIGSRRFFWR